MNKRNTVADLRPGDMFRPMGAGPEHACRVTNGRGKTTGAGRFVSCEYLQTGVPVLQPARLQVEEHVFTVGDALAHAAASIWTSVKTGEPTTLAEVLAMPAGAASLADVARLPLMALAYRQANPNVYRLLGEVREMADAANLAPDPRAANAEGSR